MSALGVVYAATEDRLNSNTAVMRRITQVYQSDAPASAALPLIEVGAGTETPSNVFGRMGHNDTLTLHLYSNARTRDEVLELADLIDAALELPLVLADHTEARLRREFREVMREPDRKWHVPIRYRVRTFQAVAS